MFDHICKLLKIQSPRLITIELFEQILHFNPLHTNNPKNLINLPLLPMMFSIVYFTKHRFKLILINFIIVVFITGREN